MAQSIAEHKAEREAKEAAEAAEVAANQKVLDDEQGDGELEPEETQDIQNEDDEPGDGDLESDDPEADDKANLEDKPYDVFGDDEQDDDTPDEKGMMPVRAHVKQKDKLKGRLIKRDTEIEELKAENEALKAKGAAPVVQGLDDPMPTMESCNHDAEVLTKETAEWTLRQVDRKREVDEVAVAREKKNAAAREIITQGVESHYTRAETFATEHKIKSETYQAADLAVRKAIEEVAPGMGDIIADGLIAHMGPSSEAVFFGIGTKPKMLRELQETFIKDPTGLEGAMYLGQLKGKLNKNSKRTSQAPKPAKTANGDGNPTSGKALKKKYDEAGGAGNQEAWSIKRAAKAKGVDVSGW